MCPSHGYFFLGFQSGLTFKLLVNRFSCWTKFNCYDLLTLLDNDYLFSYRLLGYAGSMDYMVLWCISSIKDWTILGLP